MDHRRESWKKQKRRRLTILVLNQFFSFVRILRDLYLCLVSVSGINDPRTGLPKRLLEQWKFEKLISAGRHGPTFEAIGAGRVKKAFLGRTVIIKIRDKSR